MKLSKKDKEILANMGVPEEDFEQIERATTKTTFELNYLGVNELGNITVFRKHIGIRETIKILGREEFLSGMARSAFHRSAVRGNGSQNVLFDSSNLFM